MSANPPKIPPKKPEPGTPKSGSESPKENESSLGFNEMEDDVDGPSPTASGAATPTPGAATPATPVSGASTLGAGASATSTPGGAPAGAVSGGAYSAAVDKKGGADTKHSVETVAAARRGATNRKGEAEEEMNLDETTRFIKLYIGSLSTDKATKFVNSFATSDAEARTSERFYLTEDITNPLTYLQGLRDKLEQLFGSTYMTQSINEDINARKNQPEKLEEYAIALQRELVAQVAGIKMRAGSSAEARPSGTPATGSVTPASRTPASEDPAAKLGTVQAKFGTGSLVVPPEVADGRSRVTSDASVASGESTPTQLYAMQAQRPEADLVTDANLKKIRENLEKVIKEEKLAWTVEQEKQKVVVKNERSQELFSAQAIGEQTKFNFPTTQPIEPKTAIVALKSCEQPITLNSGKAKDIRAFAAASIETGIPIELSAKTKRFIETNDELRNDANVQRLLGSKPSKPEPTGDLPPTPPPTHPRP